MKLSSSTAFWYPVTVFQIDDEGVLQEMQIRARFRRLPADQAAEFVKGQIDMNLYAKCAEEADFDAEQASKRYGVRQVLAHGAEKMSCAQQADELMKIMVGWADVSAPVLDEGGNETGVEAVPFTRDSLVRLLQEHVRNYAAIRDKFGTAINGEGKTGN